MEGKALRSLLMTLKELEQKISQLLPGELAEFREWFLHFDGERWQPTAIGVQHRLHERTFGVMSRFG